MGDERCVCERESEQKEVGVCVSEQKEVGCETSESDASELPFLMQHGSTVAAALISTCLHARHEFVGIQK